MRQRNTLGANSRHHDVLRQAACESIVAVVVVEVECIEFARSLPSAVRLPCAAYRTLPTTRHSGGSRAAPSRVSLLQQRERPPRPCAANVEGKASR